ncbi:MlaD family protein [Legionella dresdenensis]|uniref:MlaD family protein n=1 Tax=Legionella dresdenensis TaxID=450200 RepID=A0ABV8CFA2_9GAMM
MQKDNLYIGIGIFVFGAALLGIAGAFFIYSQYLHAKVETYVMLFQGSLNGLDVTSPITYRGVKIGEVKRVELTTNKKMNVSIPVYVEFFVEKTFEQHDDPIKILIDSGIVASITAPNILTGTASIELVPAEKKQTPVKIKTFRGVNMFPTETAIGDDMTATDTLKAARKTLNDISALLRSKDFKDTITSFREMANSIDHLANSIDHQMPGSLIYFNESMKELSKAAYSTRSLADYLLRHPEALLRGR